MSSQGRSQGIRSEEGKTEIRLAQYLKISNNTTYDTNEFYCNVELRYLFKNY